MTTFTFAPATRERARARIGLQGPGGSGKTKTMLRLADGLAQGGTIGVIDTERESALTYAPVPGRPDLGGHQFVHLPMTVCSPENLIDAVESARTAGIVVLCIDSWSHFWAGNGGLLERVDQEARKPGHYGGSYTAWGPVNQLEQNMLDALMGFPGHVIVTMRTKNDYEMQGKSVTKIGVKTIQREGAEYELGLVIDMVKGTGTVTKTRYEPLTDLVIHHPGEDLAATVLEQLGQGVDPVQVIVDEVMGDGLTYARALELHATANGRGLLTSGILHPTTGVPTTLGDLVRERGSAVKPAAVPAPQPADATPQEPAPVQAAEPQPAPAPRAAASPAPPRVVSPQQMRMMHALFTKVGCSGRENRLHATSLIVGRDVPSANDLTADEAGTLLDALSLSNVQADPAVHFAATVAALEPSADGPTAA